MNRNSANGKDLRNAYFEYWKTKKTKDLGDLSSLNLDDIDLKREVSWWDWFLGLVGYKKWRVVQIKIGEDPNTISTAFVNIQKVEELEKKLLRTIRWVLDIDNVSFYKSFFQSDKMKKLATVAAVRENTDYLIRQLINIQGRIIAFDEVRSMVEEAEAQRAQFITVSKKPYQNEQLPVLV